MAEAASAAAEAAAADATDRLSGLYSNAKGLVSQGEPALFILGGFFS
ncbi:MAG: hypothetical protein MZU91_10655 [Desulfosudis oleivorans]|nr:hypothetical protein [Desulfosudis oleivorans]